MTLALAAALALQAASPGQPDLDWIAGYWLQCTGDREVAELWLTRRGGVLMGVGITEGRQAFGYEQMRIESTDDLETMQFVARPRGAAAETPFRMSRAGRQEAVFDNPAHDYPQRIAYRREGDVLIARTEGAGGADAQEFRYRRAALNERCPGAAAEAVSQKPSPGGEGALRAARLSGLPRQAKINHPSG